MTEQEMRQAIIAALDEFMYRLETKFVTRVEFDRVRENTSEHDASLMVLYAKFDNLVHEFRRLRASADRIVVALVVGVVGWIGTMVLNVLTTVP